MVLILLDDCYVFVWICYVVYCLICVVFVLWSRCVDFFWDLDWFGSDVLFFVFVDDVDWVGWGVCCV